MLDVELIFESSASNDDEVAKDNHDTVESVPPTDVNDRANESDNEIPGTPNALSTQNEEQQVLEAITDRTKSPFSCGQNHSDDTPSPSIAANIEDNVLQVLSFLRTTTPANLFGHIVHHKQLFNWIAAYNNRQHAVPFFMTMVVHDNNHGGRRHLILIHSCSASSHNCSCDKNHLYSVPRDLRTNKKVNTNNFLVPMCFKDTILALMAYIYFDLPEIRGVNAEAMRLYGFGQIYCPAVKTIMNTAFLLEMKPNT